MNLTAASFGSSVHLPENYSFVGNQTSPLHRLDIDRKPKNYVREKRAIQFTFDLNTGKASGNWNNPVTSQAEAVTVNLTFFKSATAPEGKYYIFYGDKSSDKAGYGFTFILL
jgi:hypothetical protein